MHQSYVFIKCPLVILQITKTIRRGVKAKLQNNPGLFPVALIDVLCLFISLSTRTVVRCMTEFHVSRTASYSSTFRRIRNRNRERLYSQFFHERWAEFIGEYSLNVDRAHSLNSFVCLAGSSRRISTEILTYWTPITLSVSALRSACAK